MRPRRIKVNPREAASTMHLITKAHNGEWIFNRREKNKFRTLMRQAQEFCGLQLYTHAVMANHPHQLAHNPRWEQDPDDAEILRRFKILNPGKEIKYRGMKLEVVAAHLRANTEKGMEFRRKQLAQMGDFSQYMKIVKQRFTVWFNRVHRRSGTAWNGVFKSLLVETDSGALQAMAAYIDLNPVRAGVVKDPKHYAFSGYGEAVAGDRAAQAGIMRLIGADRWEQAQAEYRKLLYAVGTKPKEQGAAIPIEAFEKVVAEKGKLSLVDTLHLRIRRLTDGLVFGSQEFVAQHLDALVKAQQRRRRTQPRPMPDVTDWGGLATLRGLVGPP